MRTVNDYACEHCYAGQVECECCGSTIECEYCLGTGLNADKIDIKRWQAAEAAWLKTIGGCSFSHIVDGKAIGKRSIVAGNLFIYNELDVIGEPSITLSSETTSAACSFRFPHLAAAPFFALSCFCSVVMLSAAALPPREAMVFSTRCSSFELGIDPVFEAEWADASEVDTGAGI